jgi:hypothetical protein
MALQQVHVPFSFVLLRTLRQYQHTHRLVSLLRLISGVTHLVLMCAGCVRVRLFCLVERLIAAYKKCCPGAEEARSSQYQANT